MNSQDWFPLGWTGWISWQFKGLPSVFPNTTVQIYLGWDFLFRIALIPMNTWRCSNSENLNMENLRAAEGHLSGAEAKPGVQFYVRRAPASGKVVMDFPGPPVVKTPWFQCRGHHFYLWLGKIPHADWCGQNVKGKKKERKEGRKKMKSGEMPGQHPPPVLWTQVLCLLEKPASCPHPCGTTVGGLPFALLFLQAEGPLLPRSQNKADTTNLRNQWPQSRRK